MVPKVNFGDVTAARSIRTYCCKRRVLVEVYPDHAQWDALKAIVALAAVSPIVPVWIRVSEHGLSWLYPEGRFGYCHWAEIEPMIGPVYTTKRRGAKDDPPVPEGPGPHIPASSRKGGRRG